MEQVSQNMDGSVVERILQDPDTALATLCKRSLFVFMQEFWDTIIEEVPVWNWHIPFLCDVFQSTMERVARFEPKEQDIIVNIAPGTTKTITSTVMAVAWSWTRWPWMRHICGSYSSDLALIHAGFCRDIIYSDKYTRLFPELRIRPDWDSKQDFRIQYFTDAGWRTGGGRQTTSVGSKGTGLHGHILWVDDPLNPKQAVSETMLQTANNWIDHTLSTRKVNKEVSTMIMIMQRLANDDPSGHLLDKKKDKVFHIKLPAEINSGYEVKPKALKKFYTNGYMDETRMGASVIEEMKLDLGEKYPGQCGQEPSPPGGGMFKRTHWKYIDSFNIKSAEFAVRAWDKAGTEDGGAFTSGVLMAQLANEDIVVVDVIRAQRELFDREELIHNTAEADGPYVSIVLEQEPGSGGKDSYLYSQRNLEDTGGLVHAYRPTGPKQGRAEPWAKHVRKGKVYLVKALWNVDFVNEHADFPYGKYKDQVDSAAMGFSNLYLGPRAGALRAK